MSDERIREQIADLTADKTVHVEAMLSRDINAAIYSYAGQITISAAIGVLERIKCEMMLNGRISV